jgi:predicted deacylase
MRAVAIEMGGRSREEVAWALRIAQGVDRVLVAAGVLLPGSQESRESGVEIERQIVVRPAAGGLFVPSLSEEDVGTLVSRGTELGRLVDPATLETREVFVAPFQPTALMLLRPRIALLSAGDMTYVLGEPRV